MTRILSLLVVALAGVVSADAPKPVELTFDDQFEAKQELAARRGKVVVLVYGDRKGIDACRTFGETLHVAFHPTAKGLPPAKARLEPTAPLAGLPAGQTAPEVEVIPVACCGPVPNVVRALIRSQVKGGSPDVPVWLDFADTMVKHFGLTTGQVNVAVFDAAGVYRHGLTGTPDEAKAKELMQTIQNLRAAGVK